MCTYLYIVQHLAQLLKLTCLLGCVGLMMCTTGDYHLERVVLSAELALPCPNLLLTAGVGSRVPWGADLA